MKARGSLTTLQRSATCPCSEQDQITTCPQPTYWRFILTLSPIYAWVIQVVSFPQVSPPKPCMHISPIHAIYPAYPILLHLITRIIFGEAYRSISYSLFVFPNPLLPRPSWPQIFPFSTLFSNTLSLLCSLKIVPFPLIINKLLLVETESLNCIKTIFFLHFSFVIFWYIFLSPWARGGTVGWCTALQAGRSRFRSGFFIDLNPSGRTMDLGLTQPLTEISTSNISWGLNLEASTSWNPQGPVQASAVIAVPFFPFSSYLSSLHSLLLYSHLVSYALGLLFYAFYLPALYFYDPFCSDVALIGQNINPGL